MAKRKTVINLVSNNKIELNFNGNGKEIFIIFVALAVICIIGQQLSARDILLVIIECLCR